MIRGMRSSKPVIVGVDTDKDERVSLANKVNTPLH